LEKQVLERHFEKLQDLAPSITPSDVKTPEAKFENFGNFWKFLCF